MDRSGAQYTPKSCFSSPVGRRLRRAPFLHFPLLKFLLVVAALFVFSLSSQAETRTGLFGAKGSQAYYAIAVPAGQSTLVIKTWGGTGDCDLYVKFGSRPSTSNYDYCPYFSGNTETVTVNNPSAGDWYFMIRGYSAFYGMSLSADYSTPITVPASPTGLIAAGASSFIGLVWQDNANNEIGYRVERKTGSGGIWGLYTTVGANVTSYTDYSVAAGNTYYYRVYAYNTAGFSTNYSNDASATITAPSVTTLANGQDLTGRSGATGSVAHYKIYVPAGQSALLVRTLGGTGDCDLYVKFGSPASTSNFNYRQNLLGNEETIIADNPASGDWYIMLYGTNAFSGMSLGTVYVMRVATPSFSPGGGTYSNPQSVTISCGTSGATVRYTTDGSEPTSASVQYTGPIAINSTTTLKARAFKSGMLDSYTTVPALYTITASNNVTTLNNGQVLTSRFGGTGSLVHYKIYVPSGQASLVITTSGGTGDCDLYAKLGSQASTSIYSYSSQGYTNNETVTVNSPASGDWYIMLRGYGTYSGASLQATYSANAGYAFKLPLPSSYLWPCTTQAGEGDTHTGNNFYSLDFARSSTWSSSSDVPIYSMHAGKVIDGFWGPPNTTAYGTKYKGFPLSGNGYFVRIDMDQDGNQNTGITTVYLHFKYPPSVSLNSIVTASTVLGYMGNTGNSSGTHLHFTVRYNGIGTDGQSELERMLIEGRKLRDFRTGTSYKSKR
jgi:murein DD-endopeptidase MepM/ murein hydrolase activator NlpD